MVIAILDAAVVQKIELAMISINSRVLINDGRTQWLWSDSDDSDDDHSNGGDNYGWGFAMIVTMTMMVGMIVAMTLLLSMMVATMIPGYDRDDFCDSDEGSNDHTGIVNF